MDLEQNNSLAKLPLLKQEEGNSFKPVAQTTREADGTSTTTIPGAVTTEEKILKKNDLKAQSILMVTLLSEHLLTFNKHKDAKSLFEAIEARFGGHSSTNDGNTANVHVSTGSTPVSTASTKNSTACLSDATIYAYLATQPNGSQVVHEDLDQIHEDDLDEMDLKWQLALLSMKARKFYQRTGKKIIINGSDTAGYDKKKVECFNCHKLGHFARECRNPKSQENRSRSQDSSRRTVNVEEASPKAMLAIDGTGFDWSYMAQEEASTNFALMAFSDSEVQNNKTCSKTCLKNYEDLKTQYDKLRVELRKSESDLSNYKRGLASVEERLVFYKKNESMLSDQIAVLKRDASFNESNINGLEKQVERLKKEKEENQFKIDNFENASKSLEQLIANQISDNHKKGLGYNAVPPPLTGLFAPPSVDLSSSGIEKFKEPEFEGYGVKVDKGASENVSKEVKKTLDAPIIKDWVSDCDEDETVVLESLNVQKPKQADQPRKVSQNPRNNSTSWNIPKPKKLGVGFQFTPKACFVCGSFNHLIKDCDFHDKKMVQKPVLNNVKKVTGQREVRPVWTNAMRINHQNFSNTRRNFAPTAVLTKSGLIPFSTAGQSFSRKAAPVSAARPFNTAVHKPIVNVAKPRTNVFQKAHSSLRRPFYQQTVFKNRNLSYKVNTANVISVNTVKEKRMTNTIGKQGINAVKPITYWAWRPKVKMINHVYKDTGLCVCKQFNYVDPTGRNKVLNSPYFMVKSWLVQDQTVLGQTATGKESSNPFMAGSLPKTMSPLIHISQEVILFEKRDMDNLKSEDWKISSSSTTKEYLISKDSVKQGKIVETDDSGVEYNKIYGVHSLFLDGTSIQINMLVDKKYPLKKEILKKMINLKIEAEEESDLASELIKFIKSQIAEQS
ncbi:ribonuclease H-like domain-containing protein [Tanacetum coccineum]